MFTMHSTETVNAMAKWMEINDSTVKKTLNNQIKCIFSEQSIRMSEVKEACSRVAAGGTFGTEHQTSSPVQVGDFVLITIIFLCYI